MKIAVVRRGRKLGTQYSLNIIILANEFFHTH